MVGLGSVFAASAVCGCACWPWAVWHFGVSAFLSYILQTDAYKAVGLDSNHLVVGAAAHLAFGAVLAFVTCSCSGGACDTKTGGKDKKKK